MNYYSFLTEKSKKLLEETKKMIMNRKIAIDKKWPISVASVKIILNNNF